MNIFVAILEKWACKHKWVKEQQVNAYAEGIERPVEIKRTYICSVCGKFKQVKL